MAATVTLSTTTLTYAANDSDSAVILGSTSGITSGVRLYIDRELLTVISLGLATNLGTSVNVLRGVDGTGSSRHPSGSTVTIGRGDQFYASDPAGLPPDVVLVSPWINVITGTSWTAQGDETGPGLSGRFWQQTVTTPSIGSLGVRVTTTAP